MRLASYILLGALLFALSCADENTLIEQIENGPNLAGFHTATQALSGIADGTEYDFTVPVKVFGPSVNDLQGSVTVRFAVDPSSTAVEGTHFRIDNKELTLSKEGDFLGVLPVTLLTEGIVAPLPVNPEVILRVEEVTGNGRVIASGKPIVLNLFYLCPHQIAGTYSVTID